MSNYQIQGCGLATKPRNTQPSMFQILSWANQKQRVQFSQQQCQQNTCIGCCKNLNQNAQNYLNDDIKIKNDTCYCQHVVNQCQFDPLSKSQVIQIQNRKNYSENKILKEKQIEIQQQHKNQSLLKKSHLYPRQIKHQLYSYQPVKLKAQRSKSADIIQKPKLEQTRTAKNQQKLIDKKTQDQRKRRIKEFELFSRVLPNSAFTTYYGKPAFQNYGRGTSDKNLKSHNVMPHRGDNNPKQLESHYTALLKGRSIKSKSSIPKKPIQQQIPCFNEKQNQQNIHLPLEKPNLIKSLRFSTIVPDNAKKAGPPKISNLINSTKAKKPKDNLLVKKQSNKQKKSKSVAIQNNDGLKYLTKRQNLIQILEQKKLKASQLAFKVTQCYPLDWKGILMNRSEIQKSNWQQIKPAGKNTIQGDHVIDIFQGKKIVNQVNLSIRK